MSRYVLTPEAEQDLDIIKAWLMDFLGRVPGAGHRRDDLTAERVRFWQEFSYRIIDDPFPRPIHVVRVLHSRQDIAAILSRPGV